MGLFRISLNRAHKTTLNIRFGLLAVRYKSDPIIPLYNFCSTEESVPLRSNFVAVAIGVLICLGPSILNLLSSSLAYFC